MSTRNTNIERRRFGFICDWICIISRARMQKADKNVDQVVFDKQESSWACRDPCPVLFEPDRTVIRFVCPTPDGLERQHRSTSGILWSFCFLILPVLFYVRLWIKFGNTSANTWEVYALGKLYFLCFLYEGSFWICYGSQQRCIFKFMRFLGKRFDAK